MTRKSKKQKFEAKLSNHEIASKNVIIVSRRQEGNPLLKFIKLVPWRYATKDEDIIVDYLLGAGACALFLSLKYHMLKPEYLWTRVEALPRHEFNLRVLLCLVDVEDNEMAIKNITKIAERQNLTLILAWSSFEAARYLETYKSYEKKNADSIREKQATPGLEGQLNKCLTSIRSVNKTDVITLATAFGSLKSIAQASIEELSLCPGIGRLKATRIYEAFHSPF
eukprot:g3306.t1